MPRLKGVQSTTFASSNYTGGRKGLSTESGGKLSAGGKFVSRRQKYYQVRTGFGLAGG